MCLKKKILLGCLITVTSISLAVNGFMLLKVRSLNYASTQLKNTISMCTQNYRVMSEIWLHTVEQLSNELDQYHKQDRARDLATWPLAEQSYITSPQGRRVNPFTLKGAQHHSGTDISTRVWRPEVLSPVDGTVVTHYPPPGGKWKGHKVYGGMIEIQDHNGRVWLLAHMSQTYSEVHEGFTVKAGQPLGRMGSTGQSTRDHLHVGLKDSHGRELNPLDWLDYAFINPQGWVQETS